MRNLVAIIDDPRYDHCHTPISYAIAFGNERIVEYLIREKKCSVDYAETTFSYPVQCTYGGDLFTKVLLIINSIIESW